MAHISKRRMTMAVGHGGPELMADPRPIKDRTFVRNSKRAIVEWLADHEFSAPLRGGVVTMEDLDPPTARLFSGICEFMFQHIDPSFEMTDMSKDVPHFLGRIGYPVRLKPSAFATINAPHVWPQLLGALEWLVSLLKYLDHSEDFYINGPVDDEDMIDEDEMDSIGGGMGEAMSEAARLECEKRQISDTLCNLYSQWLVAALEMDEIDEQFEAELESKLTINEDIERYKAANKKFELELSSVYEDGKSSIPELEHEKEELESKFERLKGFSKKYEEYRLNQAKKIETNEGIYANLQKEFEKSNKQIDELTEILKNQEISPEDVTRMKNEQKMIRQRLDHINEQFEIKKTDIYKKSHQCLFVIGEIEKGCNNCNQHCRSDSVALIPSSAKNAHGMDYTMKISSLCSKALQMNSIAPLLDTLSLSSSSSSASNNDDNKSSDDMNHMNSNSDSNSNSKKSESEDESSKFKSSNVFGHDWESNVNTLTDLVKHFGDMAHQQQERCAELDREISQLEADKKSHDSDIQGLSERINTFEEKKDAFRNQINSLKSMKVADLERTELELSEQDNYLKQQLQEEQNKLDQMKEEMELVEKHCSKREEKAEKLVDSLTDIITGHKSNVVRQLIQLDRKFDDLLDDNQKLDE